MSAYLIVHRRAITDSDALKRYRDGIDESLAKHGGKVAVRADSFEVLEGDWRPGRSHDDSEPERVVLIEFPDMAALKGWYESADYAELKRIRRQSSSSDVVAVEGNGKAAG